jgi:hypothetical protein
MLSVVSVRISVFVEINRSRVISVLYGTTPHHFRGIHNPLLMFGVIPILTLLGAQYSHPLGGSFSSIGGIFGELDRHIDTDAVCMTA